MFLLSFQAKGIALKNTKSCFPARLACCIKSRALKTKEARPVAQCHPQTDAHVICCSLDRRMRREQLARSMQQCSSDARWSDQASRASTCASNAATGDVQRQCTGHGSRSVKQIVAEKRLHIFGSLRSRSYCKQRGPEASAGREATEKVARDRRCGANSSAHSHSRHESTTFRQSGAMAPYSDASP